MADLRTRNVQTIVSTDTHRVLRDCAYTRGKTLKDMIGEVLEDFVIKVKEETQLKRTLSVP